MGDMLGGNQQRQNYPQQQQWGGPPGSVTAASNMLGVNPQLGQMMLRQSAGLPATGAGGGLSPQTFGQFGRPDLRQPYQWQGGQGNSAGPRGGPPK